MKADHLYARQVFTMLVGGTSCVVTTQLHFVSPGDFQNYAAGKGKYLEETKDCGLAEFCKST